MYQFKLQPYTLEVELWSNIETANVMYLMFCVPSEGIV